MKFKVGDKVRRIGRDHIAGLNIGETGIVIVLGGGITDVKSDKTGRSESHYTEHLELVKKGKPIKVKPLDKHLVLIDSCQNFVGVKYSYKEAAELAKQQSEDCTVYKITEVANVKTIRSVKKIQKKIKKKGGKK